MSITKQLIIEKSKPRFEIVDVEGLGKVGIQSCPQLKFSHRWSTYVDQMTGKLNPAEHAKAQIHEIIDQVCDEDGNPLFTEEDYADLAVADAEKLAPLVEAITKFNAPEKKKAKGELTDSSKSSNETIASESPLMSAAS